MTKINVDPKVFSDSLKSWRAASEAIEDAAQATKEFAAVLQSITMRYNPFVWFIIAFFWKKG